MTVQDLVADAGLPEIRDIQPLTDGPGLDNKLSLVTFVDGRQLLAREPLADGARQDHSLRAAFLERHGVGAPNVYATAADGSSLVEWIVGTSLADHLAANSADPSADEPVWNWLGISLAAVHAVVFPAPLQGNLGPSELTLRPVDPVDDLRVRLGDGQRWIEQSATQLADVPIRLRQLIDQYRDIIRAEQPCLIHGDVNLDNFVVTDTAVRPVDWDYPRVGYPLAELGALDEHAYLNGMNHGLPPAFWDGYGRSYPPDLLLLYRAAGCLNWLAGPEWSGWEADPRTSEQTKHQLRHWHQRLTMWTDALPQRLP